MSIELRAAGQADVPAILDVMGLAFDPRFGEAWSGPQLLGTLAGPGSWARLAATGGSVVGFSLCRCIGREAELLLVGVLPANRGMRASASVWSNRR